VLWTHTNCPSAMSKASPGSRTNGRNRKNEKTIAIWFFSMNYLTIRDKKEI
jgi:hypothetical protein